MSKTGKLLLLLPWLFAPHVFAADSCLTCHAGLNAGLKTPAKKFPNNIHTQTKLECANYHGGDRNSDDYEVSMNPRKGFKGHVARTAVPTRFTAWFHRNTFARRSFTLAAGLDARRHGIEPFTRRYLAEPKVE